MANDKRFVVKNGLQANNVSFVNESNTAQTITASMLSTDTLSFSGNSGQLFSITDSMSGVIFAVNDISGIPSIEVDDTGDIRLAEFGGNVSIGTSTDTHKLYVSGTSYLSGNVTIPGNSTSFLIVGSATDGVDANSTVISVGNASVFTTINATSFSGTANNATNLGGSSLATVQGQITGNAATAYSNAVTVASNATNLTSGTVAAARLGSGTANSTTVLYGNGVWSTIPTQFSNGTAYTWSAVQTFNANVSMVGNTTSMLIIGTATDGVDANSTVVSVGNATVFTTVNSTAFSGTANNATNLGGSSLATIQGQITGNAATAYTNAVTVAANASNLTTGTVAPARLGSGTANSTTVLYGNGVWAVPAGGGSFSNGTSYTWSAFQAFNAGLSTSNVVVQNNATYGILSLIASGNDIFSTANMDFSANGTAAFRISTSAQATDGSSPGITIATGTTTGAGTVGNITLQAGSRVSATGGLLTMAAGNQGNTTVGGAGAVSIFGGNNSGGGGGGAGPIVGGNITIRGGSLTNSSANVTTRTPGSIFIDGGSSANATGANLASINLGTVNALQKIQIGHASSGNLIIYASGSLGTAGQFLTSNATVAYWSSVNASAYTWADVQTFNSNVALSGNATSQIVIGSTTINATTYSGTANNADFLDGQHGSYYTNATNLSTGTVAPARLGSGTANSTTVLYGNGVWATPSGGGGTPGGSNTQIQFNDSGSFGGSAALTFDTASNTFAVGGALSANMASLTVGNSTSNVIISNNSVDIGNSTANVVISNGAITLTSNTLNIGTGSISANGWSRMPNGLLFQWGSVSANSSVGNITFPTAFTQQFVVTATSHGSLGANVWAFVLASNNTTANVRTANATARTVDWIAIGI